MTPENNEQDKSPESVPKQISLTSQENLILMMADPDSAETKAIMDAHGIEFGDQVEVTVDGVKMIVETSKEDFWTRNRKATFERQAAEHAKNMMEAEPNLEHEQLVEAVAEPMGETAIDEMESEAGLPTEPFAEVAQGAEVDNSRQALEMKAEYDRRVDTLLEQDGVGAVEKDLSKLEDEVFRLNHSLQPVRLQDASEQLRATIASIENDSYGVEAARTKLSQIEKELAAITSLLRAAGETGINDVIAITEHTRRQITEINGDLDTMQTGYAEVSRGEDASVGPDADTSMIRRELQAISSDFETFAVGLRTEQGVIKSQAETLRNTVDQLSELIRQTYSGSLEASELQAMHLTLRGVVEGLGEVTVAQKTAPLIETARGHLAVVKQQRNWG